MMRKASVSWRHVTIADLNMHHFPHWVDRAAAGRQAGFHREGQTRGFHSCRKTPSGTSGPNCLGGSYAANSPPARIADQLQPVANLDDRVRRVALHDSNGAQAGFSRFRTDRRSIAWSPSLRRAGISLRLRFVCAIAQKHRSARCVRLLATSVRPHLTSIPSFGEPPVRMWSSGDDGPHRTPST